MATITPSDLFVPEVVGDIATAILYSKLSFLTSGYVQDGRASGAYDAGGNTIKFPKFTDNGTLGAQTLPTDNSAVTPDDITMSYDSEDVVGKIIAYQWTRAAMEDVLRAANVEQFLANVVAEKSGKAIQDSLITTAAATSLTYTEAGDGFVTYNGLLAAGITNWGEYAWDEQPLLVMHSKCVFDLLMTDQAQKLGFYGGQPTVESGKIIQIAGKLIMPLDSVTTSGSGADTVYNNLLIRKNALSFFPKRDLDFNQMAIANSDAWNSWFTFRYATHLSANKPVGVIKYAAKASLNAAA